MNGKGKLRVDSSVGKLKVDSSAKCGTVKSIQFACMFCYTTGDVWKYVNPQNVELGSSKNKCEVCDGTGYRWRYEVDATITIPSLQDHHKDHPAILNAVLDSLSVTALKFIKKAFPDE